MTAPVTLCERCILPSNFPGIVIEGGICNYCREFTVENLVRKKIDLEKEIERIVELNRGVGEYDCIVAFSGGKDSSYTLMLLVEKYRLNCLAVTVDNGFISDQAQRNCKTMVSALGVDFITYTPAFEFMKDMYVRSATGDSIHAKAAIKRASAMCNSCINLINSYMLKTALRHQVSLVAGGYIGGQIPRDAAVMSIDVDKQRDLRSASLQKSVANFGPRARRYFGLGAQESYGGKVTLINPMLSVNVTEEEIIASICERGWVRVSDTGLNSSNCKLNDVGVSLHYRKHQFHPYVFEVAEQVRAATMTRSDALKKIGTIPELSDLRVQLDKLGLDLRSL